MNYLAVKDFQSFQHYKHRNPPWIKFYFGVLEDYALLQLSEVTQRHLFALWLVASRYDGFLPNDRKYLSTAIKARGRVDFDAMIASGFLTVVDESERAARIAVCVQDASADASKMLAESEQDAIASRARESQRQSQSTETEPPKPPLDSPSGRTRGKPAPWMGEINRVWGEVFPEAKAPTGAARMLSPIVDKFGIERVAAELGVYLRATQPQFLSLPKFTATFGGSVVAGSIAPAKTQGERDAESVWALCKKYGFAQCTRTTIDGELQRALDAGDIDDVEGFRAKLRKLDIPFLRAVQSDKAAIRSIAERLAA